jgi:hypothetical protein
MQAIGATGCEPHAFPAAGLKPDQATPPEGVAFRPRKRSLISHYCMDISVVGFLLLSRGLYQLGKFVFLLYLLHE